MALIKLSNIGITAISGKAGGSIYSRNKGGEYFKNFVMPTNTFSDARQSVRAVFGAISSGWRGLTQQMRNSWIEATPLYLRTNAFGDQKQLSPNALYVSQNQNLANADLPLIDTIGAPEGTNAVVGTQNIQVSATGGTMQFTFDLALDNSAILSPNEYVLEATPPYGQSVRNVDNLFRKFSTTAGGGTTPVSVVSRNNFGLGSSTSFILYRNMFGAPSVGDVVSFRLKAVNPSTGEVSAYWQASTVVV